MIRLGAAFKSSLLFFFLISFVPFCLYYYRYPVVTFYVEWLAIFLGYLALLGFFFIPYTHVWIPKISVWLVIFAGFLLIQPLLIGTKYTEFTRVSIFCIVWAALLIWVSKSLLNHVSLINIIAAGIALGAFINTLFGLSEILQNREVRGILSQANNYANYACLGIISMIYLYAKDRVVPALLATYLILTSIVLSYSHSRSIILYLVIVTLISLCYKLPKNIGLILKFITAVIIVISVAAVARIIEELNLLGTEHYSADNIRIAMATHAIKEFMANPLMGIGFGNYFYFQGDLFSVYAHNILLQLLSETGIIGTSIIVYALYRWFRTAKAVSVEAWYLYSFLAIIGIHSLLEFPLWYTHFLGITAIMLGIYSNEFYNFRFKLYMRLIYGAVVSVGLFIVSNVMYHYWTFQNNVESIDIKFENGTFVVPKDSGIEIKIKQ